MLLQWLTPAAVCNWTTCAYTHWHTQTPPEAVCCAAAGEGSFSGSFSGSCRQLAFARNLQRSPSACSPVERPHVCSILQCLAMKREPLWKAPLSTAPCNGIFSPKRSTALSSAHLKARPSIAQRIPAQHSAAQLSAAAHPSCLWPYQDTGSGQTMLARHSTARPKTQRMCPQWRPALPVQEAKPALSKAVVMVLWPCWQRICAVQPSATTHVRLVLLLRVRFCSPCTWMRSRLRPSELGPAFLQARQTALRLPLCGQVLH